MGECEPKKEPRTRTIKDEVTTEEANGLCEPYLGKGCKRNLEKVCLKTCNRLSRTCSFEWMENHNRCTACQTDNAVSFTTDIGECESKIEPRTSEKTVDPF